MTNEQTTRTDQRTSGSGRQPVPERPREQAASGGGRAGAAPEVASPYAPPESRLGDHDVYLFNEGTHYRLYERLGAHLMTHDGRVGTHFAVWAPNAQRVAVIGAFNGWSDQSHPLQSRGSSGIWEAFVPDVGEGTLYKYRIESRHRGYTVDKADPFGFMHETPPRTASIVRDLSYDWSDGEWMTSRGSRQGLDMPQSIYEVHLGSWMRVPEEGGRSLTYSELAERLAAHVTACGFTHVEFMPVMEHPFGGSWGYQTTGYFAPTSRFGTPQEFMQLIDHLHRHGIGVILDWVPSHFPNDEHGLAYFDGTHLFEHEDPRQGYHPDWNSYIFNYGRNEVRAFLISSARFWLEKYHVDGLRVDAVASMLYRDYSRAEGEWIPNKYGGRENIEAIDFLRQLNSELYGSFPDITTVAEESTAWPMVSRPTYVGGLGFGYKWDMGWMHDTLQYMSRDPVHRKYHHNELTFRAVYQFSENYVLPLSHDEVVHGKGSLLRKMPGDEWRMFANLRLLLANQWCQPGKKLLFMGGEVAQWEEWNHDASIDWHLLQYERHEGVRRTIEQLNRVYREQPALHQLDCEGAGFEWLEGNDAEHSVMAFLRAGRGRGNVVACVFNYTPMPWSNYQVGVPVGGMWREIFNSDATEFGGGGMGNFGAVEAAPVPYHGRTHSLMLTIPPLGALILKPEPEPAQDAAP